MQPLQLEQAAKWAGRFRYVEMRLFDVLGERAQLVTPDELVVFLSGASAAHGYRASLFESLLPVSVGLAHAEQLTVAFDETVDSVINGLCDLDGSELVLLLIKVIYPSCQSGLEAHLKRLVGAPDAPADRVVRRALFDLGLVLQEAHKLESVTTTVTNATVNDVALRLSQVGGMYGRFPRRVKKSDFGRIHALRRWSEGLDLIVTLSEV